MSQSLDDIEIIVVDDGSEDDTAGQVKVWAERDTRVRWVRQAAAGIVPALEAARSMARGRYLARMDADDIAFPGRLEAQLTFMEAHPELAGCGCGVVYFPADVVRDGARRYEAWLNGLSTPDQLAASVFVECPIAHPTFFFDAAVVDAVGGYVDRGWPEDYDLILRLWAGGHALGKVAAVLHGWREGDGRLSRTDARYAPEAFLACKVHYLRETLLAADRTAVIWGAGPVGKTLARALLAAGTRVTAFVELDPRKIGQEIHGAVVVSPENGVGLRGPLHLAAVGQGGARSRIVDQMRGAGMEVFRDFVPVA